MSVAALQAQAALAARPQAPRRSSTRPAAFVGPQTAAARPQQRRAAGSAPQGRRGSLIVAQAAQTEAGPGKLISKVEIPAFIPRADLIDQLVRWASIEIQENGVANVGCPCKVRGGAGAGRGRPRKAAAAAAPAAAAPCAAPL